MLDSLWVLFVSTKVVLIEDRQHSLGIFLVFGALGILGLLELVVCLGAGGGLLSPGTKSKMGRSFSRTPLRSARSLPSLSGTQVPAESRQREDEHSR